MSKLTRAVRIAAALGLLVLLLTVIVFTSAPSKAHASTIHAASSHHITSVKIASNVHPFCGTSVYWDFYPNPAYKGISGEYEFGWDCAGSNNQSWIIDWRDGTTSSFYCNNSVYDCSYGVFDTWHKYNSSGTYTAKVYNAYNSAIAAWLTVNVVN